MSRIEYKHPHGEEILQRVFKFLEYSESAKALMKSLEAAPYKMIIMTGPVSQCFAPNDKTIIMRLPALYTAAKIEQAIDFAGALAELEWARKNDQSPKASEVKTGEYGEAQHMKNLDIALKTFEIVRDLDDAGYKSVLEISRMGLGSLYKAWQKNEKYEELRNIYWQMISENSNV